MQMYSNINDLSFTIDNRLVVLIEHQSTINNNIPLRLLIYMAKVYEKIVNMKKCIKPNLKKSRVLNLLFYTTVKTSILIIQNLGFPTLSRAQKA